MKERKVRCPHCGNQTVYSDKNPFRPFCSERCRLLDLGAWADESYKVPDETQKIDVDKQNVPADEQYDD
ncbi:MAG: DNA gyrase inhibitor YacG [Bdellovibrionaceae bacterium]|nr:DNA gyrase inhibitor YacG [Pseudobdellovibrionaceae bacterium]